jgi:hypothetical protein
MLDNALRRHDTTAEPRQRSRRPLRRSLFVIVAWCGALLAVGEGCGSAWKYNYVDAERAAANQARDLFICYRDHLDLGSADLDEAVKSPALAPVLKNYVLCSLVSAYAPNRKYLAQFGVTAPPAVVVLHTDGTYHAKTEDLTPAAIREFVASAQAPGRTPRRDISVPRATDFLIHAEGVYDNAAEKAQRLNRDLLIVYKWWLDEDSTKLIARMSRPEVAARCTRTVNCVLDWDYVPNRKVAARYGVRDYPAIIVVRRDGRSEVLEGLVGIERIVAFLNRALSGGPVGRSARTAGDASPAPGGANGESSAERRSFGAKAARSSSEGESVAATAKPGWRWSNNFERARDRARERNQGLFVFIHDPTDATSARVMRVLQSDAAASLLADTVNCSLPAGARAELADTYGIAQLPTCLALKPDGAFATRQGVLTLEDIRQLADFLAR